MSEWVGASMVVYFVAFVWMSIVYMYVVVAAAEFDNNLKIYFNSIKFIDKHILARI